MGSSQRDEVVDKVRAARDAYAARFNYDIRRIVDDLKAREALYPEVLANLLPVTPRIVKVQPE